MVVDQRRRRRRDSIRPSETSYSTVPGHCNGTSAFTILRRLDDLMKSS